MEYSPQVTPSVPMARNRIVVLVLLLISVNAFVVCWTVSVRRQEHPARDAKSIIADEVAETPHGKRVVQEVQRVRSLTVQEIEKEFDNTWTTFWSGAKDGSSPVAQLNFPEILACRLRRRFIQEMDRRPADERQRIARRIDDEWWKDVEQHMERVLANFRDPKNPQPPGRGIGLKLSLATTLFCCARWSTCDDVLERIKRNRTFEIEIAKQVESIPTLIPLQRQLIPKWLTPDSACSISILIYSIRRDSTFPESKRKLVEQHLVDLKTQGRLDWETVEWNAWDARIDYFDLLPLKLGEDVIDRGPADEKFTWFRCAGYDEQQWDDVLKSILNVADGADAKAK